MVLVGKHLVSTVARNWVLAQEPRSLEAYEKGRYRNVEEPREMQLHGWPLPSEGRGRMFESSRVRHLSRGQVLILADPGR